MTRRGSALVILSAVREALQRGARLAVAAVIAAGLAVAPALAAGVAAHPVRVAPNTHPHHPRSYHAEELSALACPTVGECVAVGGNGIEVAFNPHHPLPEYSSRIDQFHSVFAVACPSARQCSASANPGRELSFDPDHAGPWAGPRGNSRELLPGTDESTVACASTGACVIAYESTVLTFDPRTRRVLARAKLPLNGGNIARIACPTRRLCVAVDYTGDEATFDPVKPLPTQAHATLDQFAGFASVSCPAATQCTAIDDAGGPEITFDPATDTVLSNADVDPHTSTGANDISCPLTTQCTLIDGNYLGVTFDPLDPTQRRLLHTGIDGEQPSIDCPTANQCTALGDTLERTFNPRTAGQGAT
jgi:hypothetical protein